MIPMIARDSHWLDNVGLLLVLVPVGGLGFILVVGGIWGLCQRMFLLVCGTRTEGTILGYQGHDEEFVGFHRAHETIPGRLLIPRYQFVDEAGETHEADAIGTKKARYSVGQRVPVIYLKDHPETCLIPHFLDTWGGPLMMLSVGLVPLGMSVWAFLGMR
jgi:hypothetical protein